MLSVNPYAQRSAGLYRAPLCFVRMYLRFSVHAPCYCPVVPVGVVPSVRVVDAAEGPVGEAPSVRVVAGVEGPVGEVPLVPAVAAVPDIALALTGPDGIVVLIGVHPVKDLNVSADGHLRFLSAGCLPYFPDCLQACFSLLHVVHPCSPTNADFDSCSPPHYVMKDFGQWTDVLNHDLRQMNS